MNKITAQQGLRYWKHWRLGYMKAQLSTQYNDNCLDSGISDEDLIDMMRSGYYEACAEIKELEQILKEVK